MTVIYITCSYMWTCGRGLWRIGVPSETVSFSDYKRKFHWIKKMCVPNLLVFVIVCVVCVSCSSEIEELRPRRQDNSGGSESGPSVSQLEESFGGTAHTVNVKQEEPPATPRTGFYFLADWNSFLEVDDQEGRRVSIKFAPKVGNARNFLAVNVPWPLRTFLLLEKNI